MNSSPYLSESEMNGCLGAVAICRGSQGTNVPSKVSKVCQHFGIWWKIVDLMPPYRFPITRHCCRMSGCEQFLIG